MTDKKQEFLDFFSQAYDCANEQMTADGFVLCWLSGRKTMVHWHLTGDIASHAPAYVTMASVAILDRAIND